MMKSAHKINTELPAPQEGILVFNMYKWHNQLDTKSNILIPIMSTATWLMIATIPCTLPRDTFDMDILFLLQNIWHRLELLANIEDTVSQDE